MSDIPSPVIFDRARSHQRPHRKSRNGCKICKARKIKCDEAHPVCGNCYRRFPNPEDECEYEHGSPQAVHSPVSARGSVYGTPTPSLNGSFSSSVPTSRAMELRLFHHYSTVTSITMPACENPAGLHMWKTTVPSLAFECPYIYSAILGVSAQHLLTLLPNDIALRTATYQYIDETITAHREEMNNEPSSNILNRFTTSLLLAMHAKLRTKYEAHSDVPYTPPVSYFMLQDGAKRIWNNYTEWTPEMKEYIDCYEHLAPLREAWTPAGRHRRGFTNQAFPYDPLPNVVELDISITEGQRDTFNHGLDYLSLIKECITLGERASWIRHRLSIAPSVLGTSFRVLMQEEHPLSLLILARIYAMMKIVDEPWWMQGTAEYEVRGLDSLVPEEWKWGMEWPIEILENSALFATNED